MKEGTLKEGTLKEGTLSVGVKPVIAFRSGPRPLPRVLGKATSLDPIHPLGTAPRWETGNA